MMSDDILGQLEVIVKQVAYNKSNPKAGFGWIPGVVMVGDGYQLPLVVPSDSNCIPRKDKNIMQVENNKRSIRLFFTNDSKDGQNHGKLIATNSEDNIVAVVNSQTLGRCRKSKKLL